MGQYVLEYGLGVQTLIQADNDEDAILEAQKIVDKMKIVAKLSQIRVVKNFIAYQKKEPSRMRELKDIPLYEN